MRAKLSPRTRLLPSCNRCGKFPHLCPTLEQVIAEIISSGDLIGRGEKGEAFLLVTLNPRTFAQLCLHGAEAEDAEEDDAPEEDDPPEANGDEGDYSRPPRLMNADELAWRAARYGVARRAV